jgi:phosphatidylglycerophosphate synthase
MDQFLPHWFWIYLCMLAAGTVLAVFVGWLVPARWLRVIGILPGFTANWVSLERAPVTLLGFAVWFAADGVNAQLWYGFLLVVFGLAMDRLDGKIAKSVLSRLQFLPQITVIDVNGQSISTSSEAREAPLTRHNQLWAWFEDRQTTLVRVPRKPGSRRFRRKRVEQTVMRRVLLEEWINQLTGYYTWLPMFRIGRQDASPHRGLHLRLTGLGEWLDPLIDKVCFLPVFAWLGGQGTLQWPAAVAMVAIDLFGTLLRTPFDTVWGLRRLQRYVREVKASSFGKSKVGFQIATLLASMPDTAGWLDGDAHNVSYWLVSGLLYLSVLAGVISVLSRLVFWQNLLKKAGLVRFNRRLGKLYEQNVN